MRRREAILTLVGATLVVMSLLTVFAIELANTQAKSKSDVEARVHERAVLATALIDSLFQTVQKQRPQEVQKYGTPTVSAATMNRNLQGNAYLALLGPGGQVIAQSSGFTANAQASLRDSSALALVRAGHPYGLGNLQKDGTSEVLNLAVKLPTAYGTRILLTGFKLSALSTFLTGDLREIPGVKGAHNYVLDGNNTVLASTYAKYPPGHVFTASTRASSGDVRGHYYDEVGLTNSTWRIALVAPAGPLFATVSGLRKWVPWMIFLAFALVAGVSLVLGRRVLRATDQLQDANMRLEGLNGELESTNAALERRATELTRSNAELEQFASIASHDLQEPLRKVRTFTQQLTVTEGDALSEKGRDYLNRANAAAERMQNLIEDLLRFSRVATHGRPFVAVDLNVVAREVLDDLEAQVEHAGAIVHVGPLPTINGDALQLRQLLQNLLSNAIKFRRDGVTPEITIDGRTVGDRAELTVTDNGIGFEQQYSRRIFRVFERLHGRSEYPGTGIGLALCRKIAERHGGTIVADGVPGAGATFTITLPLGLEEAVLALPPSIEEHQPFAGPEHANVAA